MRIRRDREIVAALALLATGLAGCSGGGSGEGFVDASFHFPKTALDGGVLAIAPAADGSSDVYVGGEFTGYGGTRSNRIVRLHADGTRDAGFRVGAGFDNRVTTIAAAANGSGNVYVGGHFTSYDGTAANRIVRLDGDGLFDAGFDTGTGFEGSSPGAAVAVSTIVPATDGSSDVYVGGLFTSYDGTTANNIARLDADGALDAAFVTGTGFDRQVIAIAAATDGSGDIYVSGDFTSYDGTTVVGIVRLDADGTLDTAFDVEAELAGGILAIVPTTDGSGDVYVSGLVYYNFFPAIYSVLRFHADGTLDAAFDVPTGVNHLVSGGGQELALAADGSGDVYVAGPYWVVSSPPTPLIVRLDADGTPDAAFDVGTGFDGGVYAMAPATDGSGDVYVGGFFLGYDGTPTIHLVALDADGALDPGFAVPSAAGFNRAVRAAAPATDGSGDVYVGGRFTHYNAAPSVHIARLDADGMPDATFDSGTGFDSDGGDVFAITSAMDGSGDVYVGTNGGTYNGTELNSPVVRLDADGTLDPGFDPSVVYLEAVSAITPAMDGSGDVYVGSFKGFFVDNPAIVRRNVDGTPDAGFDAGAGFDRDVLAIAPATDGSGDVYAGGRFTSYDGTPSSRIVRLDANGTLDDGFDIGTGFDGDVLVIAPAADGSGDVYVGGAFTSYDGTGASRIVRLNANGVLDAGFQAGTGFDNEVRTIAPATDGSGDVYVGGAFTSYDGTSSNRIVRLNANGTVDAGFHVGAGFDDGDSLFADVETITLATDGSGDIYVGGQFSFYDGTQVDRFVALNPDGSLD